jgi:hypothetical protein
MNTALEHLQAAALRLAQGGTVKDRLAEAFRQHLSELDVLQVPEPYRVEFASMCLAMTREVPLPRESPIRASIRKMSMEEAQRYAALIVRVFGAAARASQAAPAARSAPPPYSPPLLQLVAAEG